MTPKKISPLAPKTIPSLAKLDGVRLGAVEAGIKYKSRRDLAAIIFDKPAAIAGVFTRSKCPSAPVDWCRKQLDRPSSRALAIIVNSGNANAFTGKKGADAVKTSAKAGAKVFSCKNSEIFTASTGVIGEPLNTDGFERGLEKIANQACQDNWLDVAQAIMTTDTYPKLFGQSFVVKGKTYHLNGMAKGAGMIAPDMATMLSFLVTDYPVESELLQALLKRAVATSFNAISVDSDTSTSDTVLLASALNGNKPITNKSDTGVKALAKALKSVLHELAMLVIRDGEGATKHIEVRVEGAVSARSAKKIGFSIANSPLVKTAISGEDANWGRIVMAVGKAGEPAERDLLSIYFGEMRVAHKGMRDSYYREEEAAKIMKDDFIVIRVELGLGKGKATVWGCDLSHEYVAINADYRS